MVERELTLELDLGWNPSQEGARWHWAGSSSYSSVGRLALDVACQLPSIEPDSYCCINGCCYIYSHSETKYNTEKAIDFYVEWQDQLNSTVEVLQPIKEASVAFWYWVNQILVQSLVHWQIWEGNFSRSATSVCLPKHYSHVTVNFLYLLRHKDLLKW